MGEEYVFHLRYPVFDSIGRCNIYLNYAGTGNDLSDYSWYEGYEKHKIVLDTFSVLYPRSVYADALRAFSFDILHGRIPQSTTSLFISPEGDDGNSGLSEDDPLKTVSPALSMASADTLNLFTLNLANGIYSPSATGETYPLTIPESVTTLRGESKEGVILDAEGQNRVIHLENHYHCEIKDLTVTGGNSIYNSENSGGGLYCSNSSPVLQNVVFTVNYGGNGGGIYFYYSDPQMSGVTVANNTAINGGGICFYDSNVIFDSIERCNIFLNQADFGNDLYSSYGWGEPYHYTAILDTFTVLVPTSYYAYPLENFSFDIQHAKIDQVSADLYVSPSGSNDNSGLTPGDPLKNIRFATAKILADSLNPHTIHLLAGTYSPSASSEIFPYIPSLMCHWKAFRRRT